MIENKFIDAIDMIENKFIDIKGLEYFKDTFEKQLLKKLSLCPTFEHKCNSCGGTVELDINKHIFICPYCGSAYAVGTQMVNDRKR